MPAYCTKLLIVIYYELLEIISRCKHLSEITRKAKTKISLCPFIVAASNATQWLLHDYMYMIY